jgi:hypothetical protein
MTALRAGMKVTMVTEFPPSEVARAAREGVALPVKGPVYTIRNTEPGSIIETEVYLRFQEIKNGPHVGDGIEPSFGAHRFRPVVERKTSIEVFQQMLVPKKQKERV